LHAAPPDADPFDENVWRACNPAYGIFLDMGDFKRQAARAKRMPSFLSAFRNLRLNQRVYADPRFISGDDWKACSGEIDMEALRGRACYGGLDLSSTRDLSALVLAFEPECEGAPMPVLAWFWLPGGSIEERETDDKVPYTEWKREGFIETFPGRAIDRRAIALRLAEIVSAYDVRGIAFDEWRFADLQKILDEEGLKLPLEKMRQGYKSMAVCVDALEASILNRTLLHARNPILTMCMANCVVTMDPAGNRKLDKARSRSRIDGAVALAMALGLRAIQPPPVTYDFDRPLVLSA
jgi:phage terminase large subunit-like protein